MFVFCFFCLCSFLCIDHDETHGAVDEQLELAGKHRQQLDIFVVWLESEEPQRTHEVGAALDGADVEGIVGLKAREELHDVVSAQSLSDELATATVCLKAVLRFVLGSKICESGAKSPGTQEHLDKTAAIARLVEDARVICVCRELPAIAEDPHGLEL